MNTATVCREDVTRWSETNEQYWLREKLPTWKGQKRYLPCEEVPVYKVQATRKPWYLREPKDEWKWLFAILRFGREFWNVLWPVALTLGAGFLFGMMFVEWFF